MTTNRVSVTSTASSSSPPLSPRPHPSPAIRKPSSGGKIFRTFTQRGWGGGRPSWVLKARRHVSEDTGPLSPVEGPIGEAKWISRSQPSLMQQQSHGQLPSVTEDPVPPSPLPRRFQGESGQMTTSLHETRPRDPERNGDIKEPLSPRHNLISSPSHPQKPISGPQAFEQDDVVREEKGRIVSGSLPALLKRLTPTKDFCPDKSYVFAFLLNARAFIAPADILHQILQHCIFEQNSASENFKRDSRIRFHANVLRLVKEWTENFPWDFRDGGMMERLNQLVLIYSPTDNQSLKLIHNLQAKLSRLERYEKALTNIQKESLSGAVQPHQNMNSTKTVCASPITVAQQLTHIELERLSMIGPEEFCTSLANGQNGQTNGSLGGRVWARNIQHYVDWFNRLTYLVATDVCSHLKKKHRVEAIEFFIDVAKECFNLGNFNSLMAIVAGLNMTPISRLKRTWSKVDTVKLTILQHQLDPSGNFTSYRATLKAAQWRSEGAKKDCEKIVVPFFSLFVKDILVIEQKCLKRLPNGHLNFLAFLQSAHQMREFVQWKQVQCPFQRDSALLQHVLTSPVYTDKALQLASFECENPEQVSEKDYHKQLRHDLQWLK